MPSLLAGVGQLNCGTVYRADVVRLGSELFEELGDDVDEALQLGVDRHRLVLGELGPLIGRLGVVASHITDVLRRRHLPFIVGNNKKQGKCLPILDTEHWAQS